MGDAVLCLGPLFSGLKNKMAKGLDKLNGFMKEDDEEGDDVFDKALDKLEGRFEKGIERRIERDERKWKEEEEAEERKWREEAEEEERKLKEEEEMWEREDRLIDFEESVKEKYERGEELTAQEQKALGLIMENEQLEVEKQQIIEAAKEERKEKRKEMFSKIGKAIAGIGAKGASANGSATNNSQSNTSPQKNVRKVWTMRYIGQGRSDGPEILQVPSANQTGRPTGNEIKEALMSLGYDSGTASSLANGGGESTWEVIG